MADTQTFPVTIEVNYLEQIPMALMPKFPIAVDPSTEIAPLVTALNYMIKGVGYLKVRIVVFSSNAYPAPKIGITNNNSIFYIQEGSASDDQTPRASGQAVYNISYFDFVLNTDFLVNQITVFNNLADPKTSRGTVTTVQSTMPPLTDPIVTPVS